MRWIVRLVVLAALVVVAQRLCARQADLAAITDEFDNQRVGIERAETDLDALGKSIDEVAARLHELDVKVTAIERQYPSGIPQSEYADYSALLTARNDVAAQHDVLVSRQEAFAEDCRRRVDEHNARVEEANALARRSTPWAVALDLWDGLVDSRRQR
jgi:hypothetical protein